VEDRLDELSLENHQLRKRLRSLTIIMVLFMLAVGGIAGAVLMKVREPHEHAAPREIVLSDDKAMTTLSARGLQVEMKNGAKVEVTHDGAAPWLYMQDLGKGRNTSLFAGKLDVSGDAGKTAVALTTEGPPAVNLESGGSRVVLDRATLERLLQPPAPPPPAPTPTPAPAEPTAPGPP
jgi:hypothetical protein